MRVATDGTTGAREDRRSSSATRRSAGAGAPEVRGAAGGTAGEREDQEDSSATGRKVQRVFLLVLVLNLAVAVAKAVFGLLAGSVSMVADAIHSGGFDSFSNVVGIIASTSPGNPPRPPRTPPLRPRQDRDARDPGHRGGDAPPDRRRDPLRGGVQAAHRPGRPRDHPCHCRGHGRNARHQPRRIHL